jgi:hypothetical protein
MFPKITDKNYMRFCEFTKRLKRMTTKTGGFGIICSRGDLSPPDLNSLAVQYVSTHDFIIINFT